MRLHLVLRPGAKLSSDYHKWEVSAAYKDTETSNISPQGPVSKHKVFINETQCILNLQLCSWAIRMARLMGVKKQMY